MGTLSEPGLDSPWLDLDGLPLSEGEPVFNEPWHAQAFALAVKLHEQGMFTWPEWAEALSEEIAAAKERGEADLGDTYYEHWLSALERLSLKHSELEPNQLERRKNDWREAYLSTPHGQPVLLKTK